MYTVSSEQHKDLAENLVRVMIIQHGWATTDGLPRDHPCDIISLQSIEGSKNPLYHQVKWLGNNKRIPVTSRMLPKSERISNEEDYPPLGSVRTKSGRVLYWYAQMGIDWIHGVDKQLNIYSYNVSTFDLHRHGINIKEIPTDEFPRHEVPTAANSRKVQENKPNLTNFLYKENKNG